MYFHVSSKLFVELNINYHRIINSKTINRYLDYHYLVIQYSVGIDVMKTRDPAVKASGLTEAYIPLAPVFMCLIWLTHYTALLLYIQHWVYI